MDGKETATEAGMQRGYTFVPFRSLMSDKTPPSNFPGVEVPKQCSTCEYSHKSDGPLQCRADAPCGEGWAQVADTDCCPDYKRSSAVCTAIVVARKEFDAEESAVFRADEEAIAAKQKKAKDKWTARTMEILETSDEPV